MISLSFLKAFVGKPNDEKVSSDVGVYYSVETNYRLFLFSELFSAYDRMIYLDCDTVVTGDISRLFDMPLKGSFVYKASRIFREKAL